MSGERPGYNLWKRAGRRNLGYNKRFLIRNSPLRSFVLKDTFGPLVCKIIGHKSFSIEDRDETYNFACSRCGNYLLEGE